MIASPQPIRTLADIEAIEQHDRHQLIPAQSTLDLLLQGMQHDPEKPALIWMRSAAEFQTTQMLTYRQFTARVFQTANMLHGLGVGPHDVVSLLLPHIPQAHIALWGAEAAGVVNPIDPRLGDNQIKHLLLTAQTKVLIALGPLPGSDIWDKVERIRHDIPSLTTILQVNLGGAGTLGIPDFDRRLAEFPGDHLVSQRVIPPQEMAALFHTGGTTDMPKLARHSHENEVYNAWAIGLATAIHTESICLSGLPLHHVSPALVNSLAVLSAGATILMLGPLGFKEDGALKHLWRVINHHHVTNMFAVPLIYNNLCDIPVDADISTLMVPGCGADKISIEQIQRFEAHSKLHLIQGYGLSEASCACAVEPWASEPAKRKVGSVGFRLPYETIRILKVDEEDRVERECAVDEEGVIAIQGPHVFSGYLGGGAQPFFPDKSLDTGDLGKLDSDGFLWITGRRKNVIIRSGQNFSPAIIEEVLQQLGPDVVREAAAVGKPAAPIGEVPVVYVVIGPDAQVTEAELLAHAQEKVQPSYARPDEIFIVPSLPRTLMTKINYAELRRDVIRRMVEKVLHERGVVAACTVERGTSATYAVTVTLPAASLVDPTQVQHIIQETLQSVNYTLTIVPGSQPHE